MQDFQDPSIFGHMTPVKPQLIVFTLCGNGPDYLFQVFMLRKVASFFEFQSQNKYIPQNVELPFKPQKISQLLKNELTR